MKKDKFLSALVLTSCLLSISLGTSTQALAGYTLDQEAEVTLWSDYIKDYANDAFGYLSRANVHLEAREYAKAIADYDAALKIDQYNTDAYVKRANAKYQINDLEGALKDYAVALEINPSLPEARFNAGRIFYRTQDYQKAVENMRAGVKLAGEVPEYRFELARAEYKAGMYNESFANFSKAIELKENYLDAYYGNGLAAMNLGKYNDAVNCFDKVIKSGQKYENASYYKGIAEYQLGKYDAAIDDFDVALKENPQDGLVYNFRGKANELLGNKSAAKKDYKMAKDLGVTTVGLSAADKAVEKVQTVTAEKKTLPTPVEIENESSPAESVAELPLKPEERQILDEATNRRLAGESIAAGDVYSAVALYDSVVQNDPANSANYVERAGLKLKVEDFDGAIKDAEMALQVNTASPAEALFIEGQAYEGKGNYPLAYRAYALALREAPETPQYKYYFGKTAVEVGRFAEADEVLTLLLDSNSADYPKAYLERGKARYQMGEFYSSIADLTKYLNSDKKSKFTQLKEYYVQDVDSAEAYFYRAMSKTALKNNEDALKDFDLAIRHDKNNVNYYLYRAKTNYAMENYTKVTNDYKKVVNIKKDNATTQDHLRVAQSSMLSGNESDALVYYDIIIKKDKLNDAVYLERARLYEKMGNHYQAVSDYTTALDLNPALKNVYKERGKVYINMNSYRKGISDLDEAIKYEPNNRDLYYTRARAKQAYGDKDGAAIDFDTAKRLEDL